MLRLCYEVIRHPKLLDLYHDHRGGAKITLLHVKISFFLFFYEKKKALVGHSITGLKKN